MSWRRLGRFFGDLRPSWERLRRVLGPLGAVLGHLGGVLGALWAPNPNKSEGAELLEAILGSVLGGSWRVLGALKGVLEGIFASLGASWACLNKKLEKDSTFEVSKTCFRQLLRLRNHEIQRFSSTGALFYKKSLFCDVFYFVLFLACLGGLVGLILEVLGRSWRHLGPGQGRSSKVRSSQVRSSPVKMALGTTARLG